MGYVSESQNGTEIYLYFSPKEELCLVECTHHIME